MVDCLYSAQLSPIAAFSSVYTGSRSRRGTEISAFVDFCEAAAADATVLDVDTAVEAESVRLRAAGSICIVNGRENARSAARSHREDVRSSSKMKRWLDHFLYVIWSCESGELNEALLEMRIRTLDERGGWKLSFFGCE